MSDTPAPPTPPGPPKRGRPPGSGAGLAKQRVRLRQQVHGANQSTQQIGSIKHGRRTPPAFSSTGTPGQVIHPDRVPEVQEIELLEDAAVAKARQRYMGNQAVFRDRLYARLPDVADRIVDFVLAENEHITDTKGRPFTVVKDPKKSMTKEQAHLANMILLKTMQTMAPIDETGKAIEAGARTGPVKIIVNTINGYQGGESESKPAGATQANMGQMGQAKNITTVTFDDGKEQVTEKVTEAQRQAVAGGPGAMTTFKIGG